ncbi:MAG: S24/S26 family peptidase [Armatimonadota bacterium]
MAHLMVISTGAVAAMALVGGHTGKAPLCLVQVEGMSMYPTLPPGQELLFARMPFMPGDVVLADVGEDGLVIKRIEQMDAARVLLIGDNRNRTATYDVTPRCIRGVMVCRMPFRSPLGEYSQTMAERPMPLSPPPVY